MFKDLEANFLLQCVNSAQLLARDYQFKFRRPCKSKLLLTKSLVDWTLPYQDAYLMEKSFKNDTI